MLLIPLLIVFVSLSLGRSEDHTLPKWTMILYIPIVALILVVLTNDIHQLVFQFPEGVVWSSGDYQYGILYWPVFLFMTLPILISIVITVIKSRVPDSKKIIFLPFIPYLIGLLYGVLYVLKVPFIRGFAGDMTVVFCLCLMSIYESLIRSGFIRSNDNYDLMFLNSDLRAIIYNRDLEVCCQTSSVPLPTSNNLRTSAFSISGGTIIWQEDVTEINSLIKELEEINDRLTEENNLLNAELELRERTIKIDEKARLFDTITLTVAPQLERLNNIINMKSNLFEILVLGTYIKRMSNLLILREDSQYLESKELKYSLQESLEVLAIGKIDAALISNCTGRVFADNLLLSYALFEGIIEMHMNSINSLFINLQIANGSLRVKIRLGTIKDDARIELDKAVNLQYIEQLTSAGGKIAIGADCDEQGSIMYEIELPRVGESL